jgi:hypothetical protein
MDLLKKYGANPMETAPKDGTILRILVDYTQKPPVPEWRVLGEANPLIDTATYGWTIGMNLLEYDEVDQWYLAGWDWEQDCFTDGHGQPIGWLPFFDNQPWPFDLEQT